MQNPKTIKDFKYRGLTYPSFLRHRFIQKLWKKWMCPREIHLFDEVLTSGGTDGNHYLVCDCCQLMVYIDRIDDKYMDKYVDKLNKEKNDDYM